MVSQVPCFVFFFLTSLCFSMHEPLEQRVLQKNYSRYSICLEKVTKAVETEDNCKRLRYSRASTLGMNIKSAGDLHAEDSYCSKLTK